MDDNPGASHHDRRILSRDPGGPPQAGRALNALSVSALVHAAALMAALLMVARPQESQSTNALPKPQEGLVWTMARGPGGGGGGGGGRRPEPPQVAERPGADRLTVRAARAPAAQPAEVAAPDLSLVIPAVATATGLRDLPGAITAVDLPVPGSRGPGRGPGSGTGDGGGDGPGDGDGLGDGRVAGTGGDIFEPGSGVSMPQVIHDPRPGYTSQAMQAKIQGVVLMEAVVQPDGTVGSVQVTRSLDQRFGLDQEAMRTIRQWRFLPGMRGNKPVAVRVAIEMTFTLR
jgi:protein TonB